MSIKLIKENKKGRTFQVDECKILYRNKGVIAGENDINVEEVIYLITESAEITLKDKKEVIEAPARIHFPAKTYHAIKALTDISFVMFEK